MWFPLFSFCNLLYSVGLKTNKHYDLEVEFMGFPKEKLHQRIERFTSFLNDQEWVTCQQINSTEKGKHLFIVSSSTELAMVIFTYAGAVQLTATAGRLKELILTWVTQEVCPYYDNSTPGELAKLDPYRYLLKESVTAHDPNAFPPSGALQLTSQDNPLVELAEFLGYVVYLLSPAVLTSPRYGIATQNEIVAQGDHLAEMLAQLITGQPEQDPSGTSHPQFSRKNYLAKNVKYPLAYWRRNTKMNGTWITQQMLADWTGLDVHTVQRIEKERRGPDHTYVYLSTARSILAALNEIREQQKLPLIQLWNIDWAPEEMDDEYV